jgi:hypothetical protein
MQFGFNLPLSGASASPAMLARLAAEGEAIGTITRRSAIISSSRSTSTRAIPIRRAASSPRAHAASGHEQLTAIAYLAAKTSRLKFLTP